jgi:chemotaxis protein CheD
MSPARSEAEFYLHPGRVFATAEPRTLRTILGSCVAICLFDPGLPAGGMNHYLLPGQPGRSAESPRFAGPALARLLASMQQLGSPKSRLQAKVFGGACVLRPAPSSAGDLGSRNVERAFELLASEHIPVINHDVGGSRSRKLLFRTHDGAAFIRRL